jgi:hypothetical protein
MMFIFFMSSIYRAVVFLINRIILKRNGPLSRQRDSLYSLH